MAAERYQPARRRNILILVADQFRADAVGVYGSRICRTPVLDRLAREGAYAPWAFTPTPLCTPARAALFTGRYPHANGLTANTHYADSPTPRLAPGERLLFEHLAAAGYRCGYVGKWHLNVGDEAAEARARGLQEFLDPAQALAQYRQRSGRRSPVVTGTARSRTMEGSHPPMCGVAPFAPEDHPDFAIAACASELVFRYRAEGLGGPDRPFALVCSFRGPHFPIEVPEPYASLYDPATVPRPRSFDDPLEGKPQGQRTHPWLQLAAHLTWPEWQRVIAMYWGFCTFIDALMGRVLQALDESGLAERTVVLATTDHGEMAGHHRMFDKGPYFYDDVVRIFQIWRAPGLIPAGTVLTRHTSLVDVVPTLLSLLGVPLLPGTPLLQGRDLAALLTGGADAPWPVEEDVVFAETNEGDRINPQQNARMVRVPGWKYVWRPDDVDELYDLAADPDELRNKLPGTDEAHRARVRSLRDLLRRWMVATDDPLYRQFMGEDL
jgi:choline-sulfatase